MAETLLFLLMTIVAGLAATDLSYILVGNVAAAWVIGGTVTLALEIMLLRSYVRMTRSETRRDRT